MNLYIHTAHHASWQASKSEVRALLGCERDALPDGGMDPQDVQGIIVWVEPKDRLKRTKIGQRYFHRVLAKCPACGGIMSVGRLQQHSKIHRRPA
jgi:hypothetical protein